MMSKVLFRAILLVLGFSVPLVAMANQPDLQDLIDETPPNGILVPPPGVYTGSISLDFPLTIDGQGQVTIDAGGKGEDPIDTLMFVPVRFCAVSDPFGTQIIVTCPTKVG
jgi:hypothetical protein